MDGILTKHAYPEPVLLLLGEAVALTGLLGASLKFDGRLILQTQSDGPVSFLVVHYSTPGHLRGYASFNSGELAKAVDGGAAPKVLLGGGQLGMTIDPGAGMERYQGIVALTGATLADAAHEYFDRSEQIPTFIRIAVARHYTGPDGSAPGKWTWRAGGLMVQKLTAEGGRFGGAELDHAMTGDDEPAGGAPWRWPRLSRTTSFWTRPCRRSGCFTGFSMKRRCGPSTPRRWPRAATARASAWRACSINSPRRTLRAWPRTTSSR